MTTLIHQKSLSHIVEVRSYFLNEKETCDIEKIDGVKNKELVAFENMCHDFVNRIKFVRSNFPSRLIHGDTSAYFIK